MFLLLEYEPKENVRKNENGGSEQDYKESRGYLIPNDLPVYVFGLFLYKIKGFSKYILLFHLKLRSATRHMRFYIHILPHKFLQVNTKI